MTVFVGCGPSEPRPAPPAPEIRVERSESSGRGVTVKVHYSHQDGGSSSMVTLDSPEKLQEYKKQVSFLLTQLEEAEKRMQVHEPQPK